MVKRVSESSKHLYGKNAGNTCRVCSAPSPGMRLCGNCYVNLAKQHPASQPPERAGRKKRR